LPKISYEVGTEEVHGGLVDLERFKDFINLLRVRLNNLNLDDCWPCLFVAQVGTDLHTTNFKPEIARILYTILSPIGSLVKGHYTDWVENPKEYPSTGIGAANVGPEFTAEEYRALGELEKQEQAVIKVSGAKPSYFMNTLQKVVIESGRWKKWLLPEEESLAFNQISEERRDWLLKTGSRYIWTNEQVVEARNVLYKNLDQSIPNPNGCVVDKITLNIEKYINAFNLKNSVDLLVYE